MIYEREDDLGFSTDPEWPAADEWCEAHGILYEECPGCDGDTYWTHTMFGRQPCLNCFGNGIVPHVCIDGEEREARPSREGTEGDRE